MSDVVEKISEEYKKSSSIALTIPGADTVTKYFGSWTDFHDGEILEAHLSRDGLSWLKIYTSSFIDKKNATVTFFFEKISDLELFDFSIQNVIGSINLSRYNDEIRLTLTPCYGLSGYIQGTLSRVDLSQE